MANQVGNLQYWVQQTIPMVYDDSLSFYELLNKVVIKLNEVIDQSNDYFSKDITEVVEQIMIEWKDDGTLEEIIGNTFTEINEKIDNNYTTLDTKIDTEITNTVADMEEGFNELDDKKPNIQKVAATYYIPTDYPDLQTAIDTLSSLYVKKGVQIELKIKSGHALSTSIILRDGDYSYFKITSESPEVNLSSSFLKESWLTGYYARLPRIATLINGGGYCTNGIYLRENSQIVVEPSCGFKYAGTTNLYVGEGSTAYARNGIFTYASRDGSADETGGSGIVAWGGTAFVEGADVSYSNTYGVQGAHGGRVSFRTGIALGVGRYCVRATNGGRMDIRDSVLGGAQFYGVYGYGASVINARNCTITNCVETGALITQASTCDLRDSTITGCGEGVVATGSSCVNLYYCKIYDTTTGASVSSRRVSNVDCFGIDIQRSKTNGLRAETGGVINVQGGKVLNSTLKDMYVDGGGSIYARDCKTTASVTTSLILGDTNVSSFNTITSNFGIIWT
jgi:parallel beta helix pectate lyase-like protein